MTNQPLIKVEASPIFLKNLRKLRKKYQRIQEDMQQVIQQLEQGELLGD
jgi:mRNA-degrading endonuclease YafQ of YafQ-DinJ toxin-antitoxin module